MNPKPRLISGRALIKIFKKLGYAKVSQKGSHIKLKNIETESVVIVPDHKELDRWTLKTILKQAGISEQDFNNFLNK
jgi:predicted RNA binding protein YcfA (HicA-like mRNA interferase family)